MKAILEFNLPEDEHLYRLAHNAYKYYSVLSDFDKAMRDTLKYSNGDFKKSEHKTIEKLRKHLLDMMQSEGISIEI